MMIMLSTSIQWRLVFSNSEFYPTFINERLSLTSSHVLYKYKTLKCSRRIDILTHNMDLHQFLSMSS